MKRKMIRNENGVVMVAALLILMLLSFVAITMTDTTIFEKIQPVEEMDRHSLLHPRIG